MTHHSFLPAVPGVHHRPKAHEAAPCEYVHLPRPRREVARRWLHCERIWNEVLVLQQLCIDGSGIYLCEQKGNQEAAEKNCGGEGRILCLVSFSQQLLHRKVQQGCNSKAENSGE